MQSISSLFAEAKNMEDITTAVDAFLKASASSEQNDASYYLDMERCVYTAIAGMLWYQGGFAKSNALGALVDLATEIKRDDSGISVLSARFAGYKSAVVELCGSEEEARKSPDWAPLVLWEAYCASGDTPETRASIVVSAIARKQRISAALTGGESGA